MEKLGKALDWPPLWTLAMVLLAGLAGWLLPWRVLGAAGPVAGLVLALAGIALMAVAVTQMARARTTVIPRRAPSALVTEGVFAFSRNPIYLGDALVIAGACLGFHAAYALPLVWVFMKVIERRFIAGEEARLIEGFGAEYGLWAGRVGRWFGRH